ncbi:inositol monophosphatase family protein [Actinomadura macrotermitis]|uniref:Inositol-1-monophosphatase n=1 Tax=Actinomadura macrotermitis TaxID=2585200 RepID=A0A7K0C5T3_9ACTN|nr:Inositol-1-monophosphatase [Actinomadura macrotermitis]
MTSHEDLLDLAVATAREAGRMLVDKRPAGGPDVVQTKSSPTDVVTQMDRAAEQLIIERIRAARPGDTFLGEEGGTQGGGPQAGDGARWVIDPIDGTVNYLYDLPDWAVSIAVEIDGVAVAGAIEMPRRGELYTAVRGGGALLHTASGTRELRVNTGVPPARALVATGFGYAAERRAHQARVLTGVLPRVRDIRRGGACCVDLCSLAAGRVDAYFERGVQAWDVAAGALIVEEAGGRVGGLHGAPVSPEFAIAAAPDLFQALHDLLVPLDPARD